MRNPPLSDSVLEKFLLKDKEMVEKLIRSLCGQDIRIEIGSGNGHFLAKAAEFNPNAVFIGCDIDFKRVKKTIKKLHEMGLSNAYLFFGRGEELLEFVEKEVLSCLYVNFPDPWPKKKHHRRRFFYPLENLNMIFSRLKKEGKLFFVSDHEEYFFFTLNERLLPYDGLISPFEKGYQHSLPDYFPTLYEEKFKKEGKPIYYTFFKKIKSNQNKIFTDKLNSEMSGVAS